MLTSQVQALLLTPVVQVLLPSLATLKICMCLLAKFFYDGPSYGYELPRQDFEAVQFRLPSSCSIRLYRAVECF